MIENQTRAHHITRLLPSLDQVSSRWANDAFISSALLCSYICRSSRSLTSRFFVVPSMCLTRVKPSSEPCIRHRRDRSQSLEVSQSINEKRAQSPAGGGGVSKKSNSQHALMIERRKWKRQREKFSLTDWLGQMKWCDVFDLSSSARAIQIQSFHFPPTLRWLRSLRRPSVCIGDPICNPATNRVTHIEISRGCI